MSSPQVTIKDIARQLGISASTVSRALKDHPEISPATKKAVTELAAKLEYEPNALALSLRNSKTNVIGLIIPQIVHYFFSQVISGIEDVAFDAGYQVMICQSDESYQREVKSVNTLIHSRIEGLLVSLSKDTKDFSHFRTVQKKNIPMVFFDRTADEIETDQVKATDYDGAYQAVKHLIDSGCGRIAHLATTEDLEIGRERFRGYIQALRDHNLPVDDRLIVQCDNQKAARLVTKRLIYELKPPDGIFAVNDLTAIGALQTAKENKVKVPDELSIIGFGNGNYSEMTDPPLSSVEQFGYQIGQKAARLLLDRIFTRVEYPAKTEIVETKLIVRQSTQRKKTRVT